MIHSIIYSISISQRSSFRRDHQRAARVWICVSRLAITACLLFSGVGLVQAAPPTPTNPTPGSTSSPGPTQGSTTVRLDWNSSSGATFYDLGVRDLSTNALVVDTQVSSSSFTASLSPDRPYRWNVAACNSTGCSTFTSARYFRTPGSIPSTPANPTPGSTSSPGPVQPNTTVDLDWRSSSGATYYDVGVRDLSTNALVVDTQVTSSSYTAHLDSGRPYRWNVAACNASGCSSFTSPRYFQTPAAVPQTPTNPTPGTTSSPGPVQASTSVGFDWDSSSGATFYDFGVRDLSTNELIVDTQLSSSSVTISLDPGRPYRWNVAACNASSECSSFTSPRYFQTPDLLPPIPTNPTPGSVSSPGPSLSNPVTLNWNLSSGATFYDLGIRDLSTNQLVIDTQVSGPPYFTNLQPNRPYRWNVAACNTTACSNFTSPRYFQITGNPDIRISPLTLTFQGSESFASRDLSRLEDAGVKASTHAESPRVVNKELVIDFRSPDHFVSSQSMNLTTPSVRLISGFEVGFARSVALETPISFSTLGVRWTGTDQSSVELSVRFSKDGSAWGDWLVITPDQHLTEVPKSVFYGKLLEAPEETRFLQYEVRMSKKDAELNSLNFILIDPGKTESAVLEKLLVPEPGVLSRTEWGCPDGESSPQWDPPQYSSVSHLIVHHTDGTNTATDWPAQVRSIWSYHTFTRGWGDIGYNYLIDPFGVIYKGRHGGDNVIGAHFSCRNSGTQGIAMLGDFVSTQPTTAALKSLEQLLAWLATREGLDPQAVSYHASSQLNLYAISGHRDGNPSTLVCTNTVCPGDALYPLLPEIRAEVAAMISGPSGQSFTIFNDGTGTLAVDSIALESAGSWIDWNPKAPFDIQPGESRDIIVNVDMNSAPDGNSTRRLLVMSNDVDENPYPGGVQISVEKSVVPSCYPLSTGHTGSGQDPTTSPGSSSGCPVGQFTEGEVVLVEAAPDSGWEVDSWAGTINDSNKALNNTVIMPANAHTVTVNYVESSSACFLLSRTHTGSGMDPVTSPGNSLGCPSGRFLEGEVVLVTADPEPGWGIGSWAGTINDVSTSIGNTVIMPPGDHSVAVNYVETGTSLIFQDGLESGNTGSWSRTVD